MHSGGLIVSSPSLLFSSLKRFSHRMLRAGASGAFCVLRSSRGACGICAGTAQRGGREAGTRSVTLLLRLPLCRGQGGDSVRPRRGAAGEETGEEGLVRTTVSVPQSRHLLTHGLCFIAKCCAGGGGRGKGPGTVLTSVGLALVAAGAPGARRPRSASRAEETLAAPLRSCAASGSAAPHGAEAPATEPRSALHDADGSCGLPASGPVAAVSGLGPSQTCLRADHPLFSRTWLSVHISVCGQLSHS